MRWPAGFVRIIADLGAFLMPVQRLDRAVHVEHPWLAQQRRGGVIQVVLQPGQALHFVDLLQVAAYRLLADHLVHAEQRRVYRIAPERGDVGVAPMTGQHRQQHGAEQVTLARCVWAAQPERAVRHPGLEQAGLLEIVDEEGELAERRDRRRGVPFDMDPAGKGVRGRGPCINCWLFTRGVSDQIPMCRAHAGRICRVRADWQSANCRI